MISRTRYLYYMPPLSNQRWESFSRAVARGEPAYRAYADVYGAEGHAAEANGCRLMRNDRVAARITELKAQAATRTEKTVASLIADLDETIIFARQCRNPAAMVQGLALQAKLLGLMAPQQLEIRHAPAPWPTQTIELSEAEWKAQFAKRTAPLELGRPSKPLRQIQVEQHQKALVVEEVVADLPDEPNLPPWKHRDIDLDET